MCAIAIIAHVHPAGAQRPRATASKTDSVVTAPRPIFHLITTWDATAMRVTHSSAADPLAYSLERLCLYYQTPFDPVLMLRMNRSPLEWPPVFADDRPDPDRQRIEIRAFLDGSGLGYRELIPLDLPPAAFAESLSAALSADQPVLMNNPLAAVIYGYDQREPDHWWWFDEAGSPEIVLESERHERFTYWSDRPTAGVAWAITGRTDRPKLSADSLSWEYLRAIVRSVQGVAAEGVRPYPLSLRRVQDLLASSDTLPALAPTHDPRDPLALGRMRRVRVDLVGVCASLAGTKRDTAITEPLKLAQYHLHTASGTLAELANALYGDATGSIDLARQWKNARARGHALQLLGDLLKSEKLALESLTAAVTAHDKSDAPAARNSRRRGR
ncbi:MAG TPA: hypothetical protein VNN55_12250 [bacterium]|nr:hypothetical protein [bacterium]